MKAGLLVGAVPEEDTRVEKSELALQHLQEGLHHFPESLMGPWQLHPRQPQPEQRKRAKDVQETNLHGRNKKNT